ncbi:MAG: family ATPase [Acidobacteriota bacterium]|nr:family ATPase [Acidobacteriota bacterium]
MKTLPIGVQTFSKLIKENHLYVDKTRDIYNLFAEGGQYYFLSRPRRFGKSLLISVLKEVFSGNKELFNGLWIYDKITWEKYPVIHLDFLGLEYGSREKLIETLKYLVNQNAKTYGIRLKEKGYDKRFRELIGELSKTNKVVILVDEYDKPLIDFVDKKEIARENRDVLKTFYGAIKGADEHLKFVFITGVSKFSKVSVFSDLNNLRDITISGSFSTLLGYTEEELLQYFEDRIDKMAGKKREGLIADIKSWYNGYSWDGKHFVYNPLSILHLFQEGHFGNYWFATGTPTFLVKSLRENKIDIKRLENYETTKLLFDSYDIDQFNVFALLFQTGYLTIKEIKEISLTQSIYRLSYPNKEVKESFLDYLAADYMGKQPDEMGYLTYKLQETIGNADLDGFFILLKSIFASVPYDIFIQEKEAYYHTIIYLLLKLLGINIAVEVETNIGRIDGVLETKSHIFIMEFKVGKASEALEQIKEKKYYEKYFPTPKHIKMIGIGFNPEERNIKEFLVEDVTHC